MNTTTSEEPMDVGKLNGRTLYVGGVKGINELAEEHGKQHDMQIHEVLNPQHQRSRFVTPIKLYVFNAKTVIIFYYACALLCLFRIIVL